MCFNNKYLSNGKRDRKTYCTLDVASSSGYPVRVLKICIDAHLWCHNYKSKKCLEIGPLPFGVRPFAIWSQTLWQTPRHCGVNRDLRNGIETGENQKPENQKPGKTKN